MKLSRAIGAAIALLFDFILAHPSDAPSLDTALPKGKAQEVWSWCDALFMAPPGGGVFLLAGNEVYRLAVLKNGRAPRPARSVRHLN